MAVRGTLSVGESRRLVEIVDPSLMRGVQVSKVLANLGSVWSNSEAPTFEDRDKDFAMSELVHHLDDFISHDWATERWVKWIAMCYTYQARPALMTTLMTCSFLLLLMFIGVLPIWTPVSYPHKIAGQELVIPKMLFFFPLGFGLFWVLLIFGHRAPGSSHYLSRIAFVDKVCINQNDVELKQRGIRALAGYLRNSDRLVMLWTRNYFTRLWCVYEVAAWLRVHGDRSFGDSIVFVPVSRVMLFIASQGGWFGFWCLWEVCNFLQIPEFITVVAGSYPCLCGLAWSLRSVVKEIMMLPEQLSCFSIREAACFCCSNKHTNPVTLEHLHCDRRLIYDGLWRWFTCSAAASEDQVLDHFDAVMRQEFQSQVLAHIGIIHMGYVDAILVCLPGVLVQFDRLPVEVPPDVMIRYFANVFTWVFCWGPSYIKLAVFGVSHALRISFRYETLVGPRMTTVFVGSLALVCSLVFYAPLAISRVIINPLPQWCVIGMFGLLTLLLFWSPYMTGRSVAIAAASEITSSGAYRGASSIRGEGSEFGPVAGTSHKPLSMVGEVEDVED